MYAFDTAWRVLKADNEKCPTCGMKKMHCMTQKMDCGGEMKKAYTIRKAALKLQYDYHTLRKMVPEYVDRYDEGPMGNDPGDGIIYDDHQPRDEKEARILQHYQQSLGLIPGLSAMELGMDDMDHDLANELAQEYFVEHMRDMESMKTGVSGRDSAPAMSPVGVTSPRPPQ